MCNVICCTPQDLYTRGLQIKCRAQIYIAAYHQGYIMDKQGTSYPYKGAYVRDPISNIYDNVWSLDFSSLYPSLIRAYNLCYTTYTTGNKHPDDQVQIFDFDEEFEKKVDIDSDEAREYMKKQERMLKPKDDQEGSEDEEDSDSDDEVPHQDGEEIDDNDMPIEPVKKSRKKKMTIIQRVHYNFRFVKKEVKEGLLPMILRKLVDERNHVRKVYQKSVPEHSVEWNVYEARQLALKQAGNGLYGFLAVPVNKALLPFIQAAITTTYMGRVSITKVNDYLESKGYQIVYNDTDSSKVFSKEKIDPSQLHIIGKKLAEEVSLNFPRPMCLEYENCSRMLAVKKKKYCYAKMDNNGNFHYDENGNIECETKGLLSSRRDNCDFQKDTFEQVLNNIMMRRPVLDSADCILRTCEALILDQIEIQKFSMNKSLGSNYKSDTASMRVFADFLKQLGREAQPGERLDYIIIESKEKTSGKRMRLLEMYIEDDKGEKIDKKYYLNLLKKPIDQIYWVGYKDLWDNIPDDVGFKFGARKMRRMYDIVGYFIDAQHYGWPLNKIRASYMTKLLKYVK